MSLSQTLQSIETIIISLMLDLGSVVQYVALETFSERSVNLDNI